MRALVKRLPDRKQQMTTNHKVILGVRCNPDVLPRRGVSSVDLEIMLDGVCAAYAVTREDLTGRSHNRHLVRIRREFCRRARTAGYSLPAIGAALRRYHTSVLHLLKTGTAG
jgi:chromosomal replication initiation ATPase DnaA